MKVTRLGGAVRMPIEAYRDFLAALEARPLAPDVLPPVVGRTVVTDQVAYSTLNYTLIGDQAGTAVTMTRLSAREDRAPDPLGERSVTLLLGLDYCDGRLPHVDVLTAAGIPDGQCFDLVSGMPVQVEMPCNIPNFQHEILPMLEQWVNLKCPSLVVFVRTEHTDSPIMRAAVRSVPRPMRNVVSFVGVRENYEGAFDEFLARYGIAGLKPESLCVLRRTPTELVEQHRLGGSPDKTDLRRLNRSVLDGLELVAKDLVNYLAVVTEGLLSNLYHDESAGAAAEIDMLRAENARLEARLERDELLLTQERSRNRELEHELATVTRHETQTQTQETVELVVEAPVAGPPPPPDPLVELVFESFEELLATARQELDLVVLGDIDEEASRLDTHSKATSWRRRTWASLLMLQRYAEQRAMGATLTFRTWLDEHPAPMLSPSAVVPSETKMTAATPELRQVRTFAVPVEVDPSGTEFFGAHIRIEPKRTSPAPRLHYLDDCGNTGRIYVGYLGKHLASRQGD